ncbi:type VII secretion integral membrane protein EccD [Rugosimonospora acidiphila]|uniref:Type VII secretion integral membrane protein EccD n=1 Tax=Rugosimonospora acidiphila TaxID=556531 RepID=A0ABP9RYM8_9ACTN
MTAPVGVGLARVTVATPKRRIDVALPENALVAELLPHLLRHAGDELPDDGERHGGWTLRRATGAELDPARSLSVQGVRDGELLNLVPRRMDWPELAYDDIVEVIAGGARRSGRSWGGAATRRCGLAVASVVFVLGLSDVLLSGPPWPLPAGCALAVAAIAALIGIVLSRAASDASAGAVLAGCALPYAFAGGLLLTAPAGTALDRLGAPQLLLGSAALTVFGVIGYAGVAATLRVFVAGIGAGLAGMLAALLCFAGTSPAGAAAITLTVALGLLPGYPLIAGSLGKLPVPVLPDRPEDILEDRPMPPREGVFAAVARATELLSGMLLGAAVIGVCCAVVLVLDGSATDYVLIVVAAAALLLRGRLFPTPTQRIPLMVSGIVLLALTVFGMTLRSPNIGVRLLLLFVVALVAGLVLAAGMVYSKRSPSPRVGRMADIVDVLAIMALVPLACAITGLYHTIQGLFASIG